MLESSKFREIVKNAPLVSIDLIVRNQNNEVLLGLRKSSPAKNTWFVPGGRIWKDEKIDAAFNRITKNELGISLNLKNAHFLRVFEHFYEENFADEPDFGTHYIVLAYEIKLSTEHSELPLKQHSNYQWMSEKNLFQNEEVHHYTKDYFRQSDVIETNTLLSLSTIFIRQQYHTIQT
jgi:colanic acid biosynthesis protein WcaH